MATLYELTAQYRAIKDAAYNNEIAPEDFNDLLSDLEGDIEDKVDGYCKVMRELRADVTALYDEEKRIRARRQALDNRIDSMKETLAAAMDAQERRSVKTPLFTLYFAQQRKLEITDLSAVPEEYIKPHERRESDVNRKAITKYILETGEILPYAKLVNGRSLNIR